MNITIDGTEYEVMCVFDGGYLSTVECGKEEFYVARDSKEAGEAAREYWEDLAQDDPEEFTCLVGSETLIRWGLGQSAGPGSTHVTSLNEWLDLWLDTPEENWAGHDGMDRKVDKCSEDLEDELGFVPTVAYRCH